MVELNYVLVRKDIFTSLMNKNTIKRWDTDTQEINDN